MNENGKNILSVSRLKVTLAIDKKITERVMGELNKNENHIFANNDKDNEWAQEYYLIYKSHEMLYRNEA